MAKVITITAFSKRELTMTKREMIETAFLGVLIQTRMLRTSDGTPHPEAYLDQSGCVPDKICEAYTILKSKKVQDIIDKVCTKI